MNKFDIFFQKAKEAGFEACEITSSKRSSTSISLYHGEVENVQSDLPINYTFRGIYNHKFGVYNLNVFTVDRIDSILESLKKNATLVEKEENAIIFKGSEKYHKVNVYNKKLDDISIEEKKAKLFELEKAVYAKSDKVSDVESTSYSESKSEYLLINSYGLKLKQTNNYFFYSTSVVAKEKEETKTNWDFFLGNKFEEFNPQELADKVVKETVEKFGGVSLEPKKMPVILTPSCVASLLGTYLGHAIAEEVQKHSSLFEGKLNTKIASKKLTVTETPLNKTIFSSWFDDEGVATYNKDVIKNGVLKTYFYNLETAAKDGVQSTGNGMRVGSKIGTGFTSIKVKPGKKTNDQLCEIMKDGLYITDLNGTNSGINADSGNFSLEAEGFLIKDGKRECPITQVTISGNLVKLFEDIKEVGSDVKMMLGGTICPSILFKSLAVSGKK